MPTIRHVAECYLPSEAATASVVGGVMLMPPLPASSAARATATGTLLVGCSPHVRFTMSASRRGWRCGGPRPIMGDRDRMSGIQRASPDPRQLAIGGSPTGDEPKVAPLRRHAEPDDSPISRPLVISSRCRSRFGAYRPIGWAAPALVGDIPVSFGPSAKGPPLAVRSFSDAVVTNASRHWKLHCRCRPQDRGAVRRAARLSEPAGPKLSFGEATSPPSTAAIPVAKPAQPTRRHYHSHRPPQPQASPHAIAARQSVPPAPAQFSEPGLGAMTASSHPCDVPVGHSTALVAAVARSLQTVGMTLDRSRVEGRPIRRARIRCAPHSGLLPGARLSRATPSPQPSRIPPCRAALYRILGPLGALAAFKQIASLRAAAKAVQPD